MNPQTDLGFLSAFLGGIAVSFSPCVFPLIPITLSFIGVKAGTSSFRGLLLSLVYVLGVAVVYSALGLIAALTGSLFGTIANHPLAYFIVGNACIIAGLSFLDVISVRYIGIQPKSGVRNTQGYFSVFVLGLTSGLAISPCVVPVLGGILAYVASRQNIVYGASLLFTFAYGMGFVLILTGVFSTTFLKLFKSEMLLIRIRKISGFILIGIGEYFLIQAGRLM